MSLITLGYFWGAVSVGFGIASDKPLVVVLGVALLAVAIYEAGKS